MSPHAGVRIRSTFCQFFSKAPAFFKCGSRGCGINGYFNSVGSWEGVGDFICEYFIRIAVKKMDRTRLYYNYLVSLTERGKFTLYLTRIFFSSNVYVYVSRHRPN